MKTRRRVQWQLCLTKMRWLSASRKDGATLKRFYGFNLLEVMMASTILIIGATGVFMGMSSTTRSEQRLTDLTVASQVMESAAETLMSIPPQHPWLAAGTHNSGDAPLHFDHLGVPVAQADGKYTVSWSVVQNQSPNQTMNGIHEIEILVQWPVAGETQSVKWKVHRR